jgi:ribonuclease P protein component
MIERTHRFHGYNSLRYVYRNGQTVRASQIALRYIENNRKKSWRVSVVVSRKVSKSAVARNRIRRRLYEIVRLNREAINKPYDLVLVVYSPQLKDMKPALLNDLTLDLFNKAGIMSKKLPHIQEPSRDIVNPKEK